MPLNNSDFAVGADSRSGRKYKRGLKFSDTMELKQMTEKTKTNCIFRNTPACELFNAGNCENCPMFNVKPEDMPDAYEDMRALCESLPEDGVEPLFYEEECLLCKGSKKGKPAGFAQLNMAHLNPNLSDSETSGQDDKTYKKRETRLVVPLQLPVCASCRRKLKLKYNLPLIITVLFCALALIITSAESVRTALMAAGRFGPFIVFATIVLLGVGIALLVKSWLASDIKKNIKTNPEEIKQLEKMLEKGWFSLPMGKENADFTFTKNRLDSGILTGDGQKKLINAVLNGNKKDDIPGTENGIPETEENPENDGKIQPDDTLSQL